MAWALVEGLVKDPAFEVEVVARDVETLNEWALDGRGLDVTALSAAAFAQVTDEYLLVPFGASFGEGYGPVVVAAQPLDPGDLPRLHVAAPGPFTTATNALKLAVGDIASLDHVPFTDILSGVKHGLFDAGVLIHEGQLTYEREGLVKVLDLGEWWAKVEPGLPFPLGVVAVRRDLGEDLLPRAVGLVKRSLDHALANRELAIAYAGKFARGLGTEDVGRFVEMYVTALTRDMRPRGADAMRRLVMRMLDAGLIEPGARFEFAPEPQMPNPATMALVEENAAAREAAARPPPPARAPVRARKAPAAKVPAKKVAKKAPAAKTPKKAPARKPAAKKAEKKPAKAAGAGRKPAKRAAKPKAPRAGAKRKSPAKRSTRRRG